MALDLTLLTTRAECDEALAGLAAELDVYGNRDTNLEFADRQSDRIQGTVSGRLLGVNALIDSYTATLGQANLPVNVRKSTEILLRRANFQKSNLGDRSAAQTGSAAFLADVDAEQVDAQVVVLTNAQTLVTAHKDTLPA
ncbi:MAG: hypothetical protein H7Z21_10530 [Hymenobacter sp.]|nr:hypothetical protein [Hymenobacter sp.]